MLANLTYGTLGDLDGGRAEAIIDAAIKTAVADIDDRGEDGKPRTVNIVVSLVRLPNSEGKIAAHVEAEAKLPRRRTASTIGLVQQKHGKANLVFQTEAPEDPHQTTIDSLED